MTPTDAGETRQIIKSLQPKKSTSHDNLSPLVIKLFGEQIAMPLSILINISVYEGIVPDELKSIPVHISQTLKTIFLITDLYYCYLQFFFNTGKSCI